MQFIRTEDWHAAASAIANRLNSALLAGQRVLWLTSGGSNVSISVEVMKQVSAEHSQNLSVMPLDERYGPPGHPDSNWAQLLEADFGSKQAKLLPALQAGLDFDQNTAYYNQLAEQAFMDNEVILAQIGIGPDGHIAGILPGSPATEINDETLVTSYDAPPLKRMTLTFEAIRKVTDAYAPVYGANKLQALTMLRDQSLPIKTQPAQILKELSEAYVYNDQLGDHNG